MAEALQRRRLVGTQAARGQVIVIFALSLTVLLGMAGLAVDVGHAYERRQFLQGAANDVARAGAQEVYANYYIHNYTVNGLPIRSDPSGFDPQEQDLAVQERMEQALASAGLSPANTNLDPPATSACAANPPLTTNQAYLVAYYVNYQNKQTDITDETSNGGIGPFPVGGGTMPDWARGVQVTDLEICVPHFFVGVLGFGKFTVGAQALFGEDGSTAPGDTAPPPNPLIATATLDPNMPSPTNTPIPTNTPPFRQPN